MNSNEFRNQLFQSINNYNMSNQTESLTNFYEQIMLQRNIAILQQQQQQQSSASTSSSPTQLSISMNNNYMLSPNQIPPKEDCPSPNGSSYESKYRAYVMNAAAAAAAASAVFPYSMFHSSMAPPISQVNGSNLSTNSNQNHRQMLMDNFPGLFNAQNKEQEHLQTQQHQLDTSTSSSSSSVSSTNSSNNLQTPQNNYRVTMKQEEPKPAHSYIGLIALAILSTPEKKLVLSDIYQWILDNYTYFHTRGSGWRNSIRHNLSLNDCFMKSGRSANGKGHYWTIHPANMEDFSRGDFRRRRAQRRVRKSLGLTIPEEDEEDDDDILTPPSSLSPTPPMSTNKKYINTTNSNISNCSSNSSGSSITNGLNSNVLSVQNDSIVQLDLYENNNKKENFMMKNTTAISVEKSLKLDQKESTYDRDNLDNNTDENYRVNASNNDEEQNDNEENYDEGDEFTNTEYDCNNDDSLAETCASENESSKKSTNIDKTENNGNNSNSRKRSFNVDALLAPDNSENSAKRFRSNCSEITIDCSSDNETKNRKENLPNQKSNKSKSSQPQQASNYTTSPINKLQVPQNSYSHHHHHHHLLQHPYNSHIYQHNSNLNHVNHSRTKQSSNSHVHNHKNSHLINEYHQNSPFSKAESNNEDVEKWKQTFSKIMARSYKNNTNNNTSASSSGNSKK